MDWTTVDQLQASVAAWCAKHAELLETLEGDGAGPPADALREALAELGLLDVLAADAGPEGWALLAGAVRELAAASAGAALRLLSHNLAGALLAAAGTPAPAGWLTLPLYDEPAVWGRGLKVSRRGRGRHLGGVWRTIPGLPGAAAVVLPLVDADGTFLLAALAPGADTAAVDGLGLRACPLGDLVCAARALPARAVIGSGPALRTAAETLWSHAEGGVAALRAGLLAAAYATAHDYARERWQGGKMIVEHSLVQRMLANVERQALAAEAQWRAACAAVVPGQPLPRPLLATGLSGADGLVPAAADALQLLGGNGYTEDYPQARRFRDAQAAVLLLGHPWAREQALWQQEAC